MNEPALGRTQEFANQVLEVAVLGTQVGLVRVDKPIAYLDIDETSLLLRRCDA